MTTTHYSAATIGRHPIYAMLAPFPVVCFTLALLTDIAYWQTAVLMWQHFSEWLLLAGIAVGAVAFVVGLVETLVRGMLLRQGRAWLYLLGTLVVLALAGVNNLVHAADGWTGVVPYGLALSAATVVVMLATAGIGRRIVLVPEVRHA